MKKQMSLFVIGLMFVSIAGAAEMMKMASPGDNHKNMEIFAGNWNYSLKMWMDVKGKPEESKGTATGKWILGGRFLQADVKGTAMGQPFEGMSIMGYDNLKGQYQSLWLDNMTTGIMQSTSMYDPAAKTFTETGVFSCPMTNEKDRPFRGSVKVADNYNYTYSMFQTGPDGKEFKAMEITYTRAQ